MLYIAKIIYNMLCSMLPWSKKKNSALQTKHTIFKNIIGNKQQDWKSPSEYLDFVQFLNDETKVSEYYRILKQKTLEYGSLPNRFMMIQIVDTKVMAISFFIDCDPEFAASMFHLAKKFFGAQVEVISSYIPSSEGICMTTDKEFANNYVKFYTKDEIPVNVKPSTKKFDLN